jgi:hypothetical protein
MASQSNAKPRGRRCHSFRIFGWLKRDQPKASRGFPIGKSSTERSCGQGQRMQTHIPNADTVERTRRLDGGDSVLELIYQTAKVVHDVEARVASANETERYTRSIAETAVKTLQDAVKRIQELEKQLESSRAKPPSQLHIRTPEASFRPTMITLVAHARQKIIAIAACFQPSVIADGTHSRTWDEGLSNVGWTEILARADAALNDASARSKNRPLYHKNHLVPQQAA